MKNLKNIKNSYLVVILCVAFLNLGSYAQPLKKIIFYDGTANEKHWNFNNGLIENITDANGTVLNDFVYDGNGRLISTTGYGFVNEVHTFAYDADGYITSYNGVAVTFHPENNSYTRDFVNDYEATYVTTGELQDFTFYVNDEGLLTLEHGHYTSNDDGSPFSVNGTTATFDNGNMKYFYTNGPFDSYSNGQFVTVSNPIKTGLLPAMRALAVAAYNEFQLKWVEPMYNSSQMPSIVYYESNQPSFEWQDFTYLLNANGKPVSVHVRNRYFDQIESEFDFMQLYYEGDFIP